MTVRLIHADCLLAMRDLEAASVDACVTDPPYGLEFMGRNWDRGVPGVEYWREVLRVLKPGGHLISFGGTRTYHRMACAIEDAGFEIRDQIQWIYGSGFPKSHDIGKAIDRAAGAEREVIGVNTNGSGPNLTKLANHGPGDTGIGYMDGSGKVFDVTAPATDSARRWNGWGTALKPAHEPIVLARKPLIGTVAQNVLTHGTGAINVDGCRVAGDVPSTGQGTSDRIYGGGKGLRPPEMGTQQFDPHPAGRWPANVIHDGSEEVVDCFPAEAGAAAPVHRRNGDKFRNTYGAFGGDVDEAGSTFRGDSGSAARFFYCAKASAADRNDGLEHMPAKLKPFFQTANGTSGKPSSISANRTETHHQNTHPTVKPTDLMRWLCRLVTPPGGTVLDPFMGSGSTGRACVREGFSFIGIERESEYIAFAEARIESARQTAEQARIEAERQPDLFEAPKPTGKFEAAA